ncbi:hypothetical protein [Paenarthrobacter ilicis]|uniref:hypothetical protein n=1 Tax=Paenarthrobacter ilicis TaxID=43665 RepID=UPI0028D2EC29|nr:hypothetical protein [Paenarthrobacter ilicis]
MKNQRPRTPFRLMKADRKLLPPSHHPRARGRSGILARHKNSGHLVLIHAADAAVASPGETVVFAAWIFNDSTSHVRDIRLVPRSLTNEGMERLCYGSAPPEADLRIAGLAPGQSVLRTFSYEVTESDHLHGGSIISAMQVLGSCRGKAICDEQDAVVFLAGSVTERLASPRASQHPAHNPRAS